MEIVQRILGKIVGQTLTNEELALISGAVKACPRGQEQTWGTNQEQTCDKPQ